MNDPDDPQSVDSHEKDSALAESSPATGAVSDEVIDAVSEPTTEVDPLQHKLDIARRELLDLTLRNRLLNTPRRSKRGSGLEIVDEKTTELFRILVTDGKDMSFLARPKRSDADDEQDPDAEAHEAFDWAESIKLEQPEEEDVDDRGVAKRHRDTKLQTALTSEALQKRLLRMFYEARTAQEEQGVNILYLALGFLKWFESESSDTERCAPLILVPVELDRRSARSRFVVRYNGDEIATNLSLQAKLYADFGITLPDISSDDDDTEFDPATYLQSVRQAIANLSRWDVLDDDISLGFFSFAKLLMYRDLDARNWPADDESLLANPLICSLLSDGFTDNGPIHDDGQLIDDVLPAIETIHVMEADSSQSLAIDEVRQGRNLVIQGPPGTGKSQTITNIIASAVAEGKRVLFLAEKLAALDVVKRRLTNIDLGDVCLELHSNKARKKAVLHELDRTLRLGVPRVGSVEQTAAQLEKSRQYLNRHAQLMHQRSDPSGLTPYQVIGQLVRLGNYGHAAPEFELVGADQWTADEVRSRHEQLEFLLNHLRAINIPNQHTWRGVGLDSSLPSDRARFAAKLPGAAQCVEDVQQSAEALGAMLSCNVGRRIRDVQRLISFGRALAEGPEMDARAMADAVWVERRAEIARLVETAGIFAKRHKELDGVVVDAAWSFEAAEARRDLAAYGRSWFRFLNGRYRRAKASLCGLLQGSLPKSLVERLGILDALIEARSAWAVLVSRDELGRQAFGRMWSGADSDMIALLEIEQWERTCSEDPNVPDGFRKVLARVADRESLSKAVHVTDASLTVCCEALDAIVEVLLLDVVIAFAGDSDARPVASLQDTRLDKWRARLDDWLADVEGVARWIGYRQQDAIVRGLGLEELCDRLFDGRIEADDAKAHFSFAYYESIVRVMMAQFPALQSFDGLTHEQILEQFCQLDRKHIELTRQRVARGHYDNIPRGGAGIGQLGQLLHQINLRRRHWPIRKLIRNCGNAITRIKPVFMMSPMSIVQYVEPGTLDFDVLVIDEASQVQPVDALGAAARAKQIVVVGDDKQLPPTRFFSRALEGDGIDDADDDDGRAVGNLESVLGLCRSQGMADRMLRWHYRSRHHSLIAVSNREFYEDQLYVIPSPTREGTHSGVVFHHVTDGAYDRSGSRTNRAEAIAVVESVVRHALEHPATSLGVVAFSVAQRDAIIDELERQRRKQPEIESFFAVGVEEPFFVKNLENVQGDERDVIYISVGYGRDGGGYMSMNFGPLSNEGGERRLNVLITRAKHRCEIFSSITDEDIDPARATGLGPRALKTYLAFARTGRLGVALPSERGHDSAFEEAVAVSLARSGYEVEPQVDEAGFFIDLAVIDPQQPGRYLLGIECDGAAYHSARSARDRDRTRQAVLEQRGWRVHRIWSTDWFNRPKDELAKVVAAIERARVECAGNGTAAVCGGDAAKLHESVSVDRVVADEDAHSFAQPYEEAAIDVPSHQALHEVPAHELAALVTRIVHIEQPVHRSEVAQRVTTRWGLTRSGSRISSALDDAIELALSRQALHLVDDAFLVLDPALTPVVRDRSQVQSSSLRQVDRLPPSELKQCMTELLMHHAGATRDELIRSTLRQLGCRMTTSLRELLDALIDELLSSGRAIQDDGRLRVETASP